jgi:uncharacterized membrane protein
LWDGVFHAFTWLMTVAGVWRLWLAVRRPDAQLSTAALVGALLLGWGLFNSVEGVIDHQLLGLHHVHPGEQQLAWDVAFIVSGLVLSCVGYGLIRRASRATA